MKICMLTSGHEVFDNRIYYKEILTLKKKYEEIYIVAPGDKDFVTKDGIFVKCFPKRKAWYDRMRPMKDMYKAAVGLKADVYHGHEPDSFQVALKLKKELGSKAVFDSHEYHPEAFAEHFNLGRGLITKAVYMYEKNMAKNADLIITVNNLLVDKFKRYNKNVLLLPNYPVIEERTFEKNYGEKPVFVYVGGLTESRGIYKVLEAIKQVRSDSKFVFVGGFESEEFKQRAMGFVESKLKGFDVEFTGKIPHPEVFKQLERASAGFVLLQPDNWRYVNSEPIKIFEYMISKTAVIGSDFPMFKNIIEGADCGRVVDPTDPEKIAECIDSMAADLEEAKKMGQRGYEKAVAKYNWGALEQEFLSTYAGLDVK